MRYLDPVTLLPPKQPSYSISSWIMNIEGAQKLWELVQTKGFSQLVMKHVSQDPLENFFGSMRAYGITSTDPSCWQFGGNYKGLLIDNLSKNKTGFNCEKSSGGELLFSVDNLITTNDEDVSWQHVEVDDEFENPAQMPNVVPYEPTGEEFLNSSLMYSTNKGETRVI